MRRREARLLQLQRLEERLRVLRLLRQQAAEQRAGRCRDRRRRRRRRSARRRRQRGRRRSSRRRRRRRNSGGRRRGSSRLPRRSLRERLERVPRQQHPYLPLAFVGQRLGARADQQVAQHALRSHVQAQRGPLPSRRCISCRVLRRCS